eukprot:PhM_4_TR10458/c2_g1_i1/m.65775
MNLKLLGPLLVPVFVQYTTTDILLKRREPQAPDCAAGRRRGRRYLLWRSNMLGVEPCLVLGTSLKHELPQSPCTLLLVLTLFTRQTHLGEQKSRAFLLSPDVCERALPLLHLQPPFDIINNIIPILIRNIVTTINHIFTIIQTAGPLIDNTPKALLQTHKRIFRQSWETRPERRGATAPLTGNNGDLTKARPFHSRDPLRTSVAQMPRERTGKIEAIITTQNTACIHGDVRNGREKRRSISPRRNWRRRRIKVYQQKRRLPTEANISASYVP